MQFLSFKPGQAAGAFRDAFFESTPERSRLFIILHYWLSFGLELWSACRVAAKRLARRPGFSLAVVAVLSVAIGSNTLVFWLVRAVLLNPLPYPAPSKLLHVTTAEGTKFGGAGCLSFAHLQALQSVEPKLVEVAGYANETFSQAGRNGPVEREAARVSSNFFRVLGVQPLLGRSFVPAEDGEANASVVILSDRFWRRNFAGDYHVIGHQINLDSRLYTVIGVLPASFQFGLLGSGVDVWVPDVTEASIVTPQQVQTGACYLNAVARVKPGVDIRKAKAAFAVRQRRFLMDFSQFSDADPKRSLEAVPLTEKLVGNYRPFCLLLALTVALFLLVGCANVACLSLARSAGQMKQLSVQVALGATRRRLILASLLDNLLLAFTGGSLGVLFTAVARHAVSRLILETLPGVHDLQVNENGSFLLLAVGISIAVALLCSVVPVLHLFGANLEQKLREAGRGTAGESRHGGFRRALATGQVAVTVPLLVGCGLLTQSFLHLRNQSLGFQAGALLTANISLPKTRYGSPQQIRRYFEAITDSLRRVPGIGGVAAASALPLHESRLAHVLPEGEAAVPVASRRLVAMQSISSSYPEVMKIPLKAGRTFTDADKQGALPVAVVNESFAREFFRGRNALGQRLWLGKNRAPWLIVGVLGDVKNEGLAAAPQPEVDVPFLQQPWPNMYLLLRSGQAGSPALLNAVRTEISKQDREQSIADPRTLESVVDEALSQARLAAKAIALFSALALLLAATGIYGVMAYDSATRRREFGVRIAVGATRLQLLGRVLRRGLTIALAGIAVGLVAALAMTRLIGHLLFGVGSYDAVSFVTGPLLFLAVAAAASLLPAWQATRFEANEILRAE